MSYLMTGITDKIHPSSMMPRSTHDQEVAWLMRQRVTDDMIGEYADNGVVQHMNSAN
jgi:hypothetical protein